MVSADPHMRKRLNSILSELSRPDSARLFAGEVRDYSMIIRALLVSPWQLQGYQIKCRATDPLCSTDRRAWSFLSFCRYT